MVFTPDVILAGLRKAIVI